MSTHPIVLQTKKGYGMIIFVPIKKKKWCHDRRFLKENIDISRGLKQVSLPDDFAQTAWENLKLLRKSLSKNV
jgi:hypothetical protein